MSLSTPEQLRWQGHLIRSVLLGSLGKDMITGPFLVAFAVQVAGLSNGQISVFLTVLPLAILARYPFLDTIRSLPRQRVTLASRAVQLACLLALLALPTDWLGLPALIGIAVLFTFGNEFLQNAVWTNFVAEVTARGDRGRFLGRLRTAKQGAALLFALFGFLYVGESLDRTEHRVLLLVVIALLLNSALWIAFIPPHPPPRSNARFSGRGRFMEIVRTSPLMGRPLALRLVDRVIAWPILSVWLVGALGLPANMVMAMAMAAMAGPILSVLIWGRRVDAMGEARIFRAAYAGMLCTLPLLMLIPDFAAIPEGGAAWWLGIAALLSFQLIGGVMGAGALMATTMYEARYVAEGAGFHALNVLSMGAQLAGAAVAGAGGLLLAASTDAMPSPAALGPVWIDPFRLATIAVLAAALIAGMRTARGIPD